MKISPIFYMGNKKRLIKKGMLEYFPKNIDCFYDLFGGSGVVSLNVEAKSYILNELDDNIFNIYKLLKYTEPLEIVAHIESKIDEYNLPKISTNSATTSKEIREYYKSNYMKFRSDYNRSKNPLDLFVLMNYCLSQTMRFNSKGEFNMPFGNNRFIKEKHTINFVNFFNKVNVPTFKITNMSCFDFHSNMFNSGDFVYLDPPYLNTTATYNENGKWDEEKQFKLLKFCEELNSNGVKFAMSNVFKNKDFINRDLIDWTNKNGFNVVSFDNFTYHALGKGAAETKEVMIINYTIKQS